MILVGIFDHEVLHDAGATLARQNGDGTTYVEPETFDPSKIPASELRIAKIRKLKEMREASNTARLSGFNSAALGAANHYSTDNVFGDSFDVEKDREDLIATYLNALRNKDVLGWTVDYPCKGVGDLTYTPKSHTAAQMIQVGDDGIAAQRLVRQRLRLRLWQIASAATVSEVQAIVW